MRHDWWGDALFVHYPVDAAQMQAKLPDGLELDLFDGVAWVGIVLISEEGIMPWPPGVPLSMLRWLGLSHHAVNVRTYVRPAGGPESSPPGIFFFTLDCDSLLPTIGARLLFNLPYRYAPGMRRVRAAERENGHTQTAAEPPTLRLESERMASRPPARVRAAWRPISTQGAHTQDGDDALGRFFVERYALYNEPGFLLRHLVLRRGARLWHGTITHEPWPLQRAHLREFDSSVLEAAGLAELVCGDPVAHASAGVGPVTFYWQGEPPGAARR